MNPLKLPMVQFPGAFQDAVVQRRKIFVGELPAQITREDLEAVFTERYGPVADITVRLPPPYIRQTRNDFTVFAFILFETEESFQKALNDFDPPHFYGQRCIIRSALKRVGPPKVYYIPESPYPSHPEMYNPAQLPPQRVMYPTPIPYDPRKSIDSSIPSFTFYGETPNRLPPIDNLQMNPYQNPSSSHFDIPFLN